MDCLFKKNLTTEEKENTNLYRLVQSLCLPTMPICFLRPGINFMGILNIFQAKSPTGLPLKRVSSPDSQLKSQEDNDDLDQQACH